MKESFSNVGAFKEYDMIADRRSNHKYDVCLSASRLLPKSLVGQHIDCIITALPEITFRPKSTLSKDSKTKVVTS